MHKSHAVWTPRDLQFLVSTLVPERRDPQHVVEVLQDDTQLLDAMLQDDRLFHELMHNDEVLLSVSPRFFFKVLILRARQDLQQEMYTIERRNLQKVVLFDAQRVVDLLQQEEVRDYLANMMASFTRLESTTIPIRVRQGIWYRLRVNDLDIDSLVRYAQMLEEEHRFRAYQRIGDACLFLTSIFPEHIGARRLYTRRSGPQLRVRSSLLHSLEDYETYGRTFYRLAGKHPQAEVAGLAEPLGQLSEKFILAEKPLTFIAERYLSLRKHHIFPL
jgi:hypothetical protein